MKKITWVFLVFLIAGCTSSRITSSWKAKDITLKHYDKILVLGIIGEPDRTLCENMEEHLAGDLKALGYNAISAMDTYGPKAFEKMNEAEALNLLFTEDIEGVVTIVLLDKEKERYYLPAQVQYSPYVFYQNHFWRYYNSMHGRIYSPGYYATDTRYFWESNFYDLRDWKLLYSAQSQSFEPGSTRALAHEYGQLIVKDIVKNAFLTPVPLKSF
jgi:hypothetical protein